MENLNLIRKIAWSFHMTTKMEFDDLFQEAALAYCEALKNYDPTKGQISTYMWHCIHSHLKNYLKLQEKQTGHLCFVDEYKTDYPVVNEPFFEKLSNEAYGIAKYIINKANKFVCMTKEDTTKRIVDAMHCKGWKTEKIQQGLQDLKTVY